MSRLKLTGKQIRAIGYEEGPVVSIAMHTMSTHFKHHTEQEALQILQEVLANPEKYLQDERLVKIAEKLTSAESPESPLLEALGDACSYNVFGAGQIEDGALQQMDVACRLPVSVAGALMPDAHHGYGLPIGGVLATNNAIIPYAVGVDIGCRMCLSIFNIEAKELENRTAFFQRELVAATLFGAGRDFSNTERGGASDDEVLERKEFKEIEFLNGLQSKAARQLGSSGSGNHFVEFGEV